MPAHLPPHKHCPHCDEPIPETKDYCSEECMVAHKVKEKRGSTKLKLFYVAAAAILILLWIFTFI